MSTFKKIMNKENPTMNSDINSVHRILKTDFKKDPNYEEDEIFDVLFRVLKMFLKLPELSQPP